MSDVPSCANCAYGFVGNDSSKTLFCLWANYQAMPQCVYNHIPIMLKLDQDEAQNCKCYVKRIRKNG